MGLRTRIIQKEADIKQAEQEAVEYIQAEHTLLDEYLASLFDDNCTDENYQFNQSQADDFPFIMVV